MWWLVTRVSPLYTSLDLQPSCLPSVLCVQEHSIRVLEEHSNELLVISMTAKMFLEQAENM